MSKVDADGNELAGVRLPPVDAPGCRMRRPEALREGFSKDEGCESDGQHIPFAITKVERLAAGDPRLSLQERYTNRDGYVMAVTRAAKKLQRQRFLLLADVQQYIEEAEAIDVLQ